MATFSKDALRELLDTASPLCISAYIPLPRAGNEKEAATHLKNIHKNIRNELEGRNYKESEIETWLEPLSTLEQQVAANNFKFAKETASLALFIAPNLFKMFEVPFEIPETAIVNERFHIKSLLPLLSEHNSFLVLTLRKSSVRVFEANRFSMTELELARNAQSTIADTLRFDVAERTLHGGEKEHKKENIVRFFREISKNIHTLLVQKNVPVVLAGVEYLHPLFREATTYNNILNEGITANTDTLSLSELHMRAWVIAQPTLARDETEAIARLSTLQATSRVSKLLGVIVPAALGARVEALLIPIGKIRWGRYKHDTNTVLEHSQKHDNDDDLLDLAAAETIRNGGKVYTVEAEKIPYGYFATALFRF